MAIFTCDPGLRGGSQISASGAISGFFRTEDLGCPQTLFTDLLSARASVAGVAGGVGSLFYEGVTYRLEGVSIGQITFLEAWFVLNPTDNTADGYFGARRIVTDIPLLQLEFAFQAFVRGTYELSQDGPASIVRLSFGSVPELPTHYMLVAPILLLLLKHLSR